MKVVGRNELKTLARRRDEATVEVEAARALRDTAHARKSELAEIDGRESLGELDAATAARMRGDIEAEVEGADEAVARAENVVRYLADRILAEAQRVADEIERKPSEVVAAAQAREAEAEAVLVSRTREREAAEEKLAEAHAKAEALLVEYDPDARERARRRERLIDWGVKNGTAAGLMQLEPGLRAEAERRIAERAAEQRERAAHAAADRSVGEGQAWPQLR